MKNLIIKEEYIKITGDTILGIILNNIVEKEQQIKEEYSKINVKYELQFEINIQKVIGETLLTISKATFRRNIAKLVKMKYLKLIKISKMYKYEINIDEIDKALIKIGANPLTKKNEVDANQIKIYEYIEKSNRKEENKIEFQIGTINDIDSVINGVKEQVEYEVMVTNNTGDDRNIYDKIVHLIIDVMASTEQIIRINKENKSLELVKNVFKKINSSIISEVINKMMNISYKVKNFKGYVITTLYNTYFEHEFQINADLKMTRSIKKVNSFCNYEGRNIDEEQIKILESMSVANCKYA